MYISKSKYEELLANERLVCALQLEVERLADLISATSGDCQVGVWCKDCKHLGTDRSVLNITKLSGLKYAAEIHGEVMFCKKHIHDICPEFEHHNKRRLPPTLTADRKG